MGGETMIDLTVLEIMPDGNTINKTIKVPDNFFVTPLTPPTEQEQLRADIDFIALMTGVEL
jgi:hypothetical protein